MLAEYFSDASWQPAAPGIVMCTVSKWNGPDEVPLRIGRKQLEIFFCQDGCLTIGRPSGAEESVRSNAVLLLSDCCRLARMQVEQPLDGICLRVDQNVVRPSFEAACRDLHLELTAEQVDQMFLSSGGCIHVPNTVWSRTMGSMLKMIPPEEQRRYCVLKCLELLYLLCTRSKMLENTASLSPNWRGMNRTIAAMRSYMEAHLDEKLTISVMSHRFQISPTAFKSGFRSLYGQPVHSWLLEKRLETATRLLLRTSMTVLQIAQEVGYESVGQFNVVFRRQYGVTPSQYRKMSHSKDF